MTTYSDMTDEALNRRVAERLGYTVVHVENDNSNGYPCFGPDRDWYWDYMYKDGGDCEPLGNWATSIDAAAALDFGDAIARVVVTLVKDGAKGEAHSAVNGRVIVDYFDPSESRMRTILWLMYKDWISAK